MILRSPRFALCAALIFCSLAVRGETVQPERTAKMDYGPFLATSLLRTKLKPADKTKKAEKPDVLALKGLVIRLGEKSSAAVCYDTETLSLAAAWTGDFLDFRGTMLTNHKGTDNCTPGGPLAFVSRGPGWAKGTDFTDPRALNLGPLPLEWAKYQGLYVNGERIVLSYTVGAAKILELPAYETAGGVSAFTRTFEIENAAAPLTLRVCDTEGASGKVADGVAQLDGATPLAAALIGAPVGVEFEISGSSIVLKIPALNAPAKFKIAIWSGAVDARAAFVKAAKEFSPATELKALCAGGPAHWKPVETHGKLGTGEQPYVVDTLTLPEPNPWNAWLRLTGVDFFPDGRAAVCTYNGDVYIVSGIDDSLGKLTWTRFATGLYDPLGLKIVDGVIYALGRDQITRLHDLNGDGEADFYENFNNDGAIHYRYNFMNFDLQADADGNFYYARCGNSETLNYPDTGCIIKVSKDGKKFESVASGLREANGLGAGPGNEIICSDNQGNWTPASKINLVHKGDFLGYTTQHHQATTPSDYTRPLCWIPHVEDTSSGGEIWIDSDKWGPLKDHYVHTSFGKARMMLVMSETVGGQIQGGVVAFPLVFDTGIMRGRFNPKDGQLYVCGVGGGWQTSGVKDGALQRVRYTGKSVAMPVQLHIQNNGVTITFSAPLDKTSANDEQNFGVEQWNYRWTESYGSLDYSVTDPQKKGHDTLEIKAARLTDERTVFLEIPGLKPAMQMAITYKIKAADGSVISQQIYNTINKVP